MDINILKKIINQMEQSSISYLEYKDSNISLKLAMQKKHNINDEIACTIKNKDIYLIKSKYVGIVKIIDNESHQSFVTLGQMVEIGDLLCVIEYLNLFIQIKSCVCGYVSEICVKNQSMIQYGEVLFKIVM
ncbi:hypothetical protein G9F73_013045 [Clostridium estertheticum]|uniref:acetyl-CoA carboxylase biotin carboxyl carrier protein n=1 Tax=Clostridium estertheticum TaxID=238834 RepID=UPI0013EEA4D0|nr:biotin/lipoyl-containing protein [Clostridium estertheticum]MBZ9608735.1 hypothetical protein [Clostridium estertheticum]